MKRISPDDLLSALDLDLTGLEAVRSATESGDTESALHELLVYYRGRTGIWYPVEKMLGVESPISNEMMAYAEGIKKNVIMARFDGLSLGYGPQDYGDDIDWDWDPVSNRNWVAGMHRFFFDKALASAYAANGDDNWAGEWVRLCSDWIGKNPADDLDSFAYSPLQIGARAWRWPADFELYKSAESFTPAFLRIFLAAVHDQAERCFYHFSGGAWNGALIEAEALLRYSLVFPEFKRSQVWLLDGYEKLTDTVTRQVSDDGVQKEWSINYHMGTANNLLNICEFLTGNGKQVPGELLSLLGQMYDYTFAALSPDRLYPMFGDPRRPEHSIDACLRRGAAYFDRPHYVDVLGEAEERYPVSLSYAFPGAGMYFMRSGWGRDSIYMAIHCSPTPNSGHDHPDNGTFELHAFRRWLMPDSGCYVYAGHGTPEAKDADFFHHARNHQTMTLNNEPTVNAPHHLLWVSEEKFDVATFENQSYKDLAHRRTIFFVEREIFVILDEGLGGAEGDIDLHFQLEPGDAVVDLAGKNARTAKEGQGNLLVWTAHDAPVTMIEEEGYTSSKMHVRCERPSFAYRFDGGSAPVFLVTLIVPFEGDVPDVSADVDGDFEPGDERVSLRVAVGGRRWTIGRDLGKGTASVES